MVYYVATLDPALLGAVSVRFPTRPVDHNMMIEMVEAGKNQPAADFWRSEPLEASTPCTRMNGSGAPRWEWLVRRLESLRSRAAVDVVVAVGGC